LTNLTRRFGKQFVSLVNEPRVKIRGFAFLLDFTLTLFKQETMDTSAVELFKELEKQYIVASSYQVGFSKELSTGVLNVIEHLKGDLHPEDLVPIPTMLTVVLKHKDKVTHPILDTFHQSSAVYMESFDRDAFEKWAESKLSVLNN
jgi:hypothetical protein